MNFDWFNPGAKFGYGHGDWGKPPIDEYGRPLYGDVFVFLQQDQPNYERNLLIRQSIGVIWKRRKKKRRKKRKRKNRLRKKNWNMAFNLLIAFQAGAIFQHLPPEWKEHVQNLGRAFEKKGYTNTYSRYDRVPENVIM